MKKLSKFGIIAVFSLVAAFAVAQDSVDLRADKAQEFTNDFVRCQVAIDVTTARATEAGAFIIEGWIYPDGFLNEDPFSGINADGGPEFPEAVIGRWICKGWPVLPREDAAGTAATTTQIYEFGEAGNNMIITEGHEVGVPLFPNTRAIVGTTGIFANNRGAQLQAIIGQNASGGANLQVVFRQKTVINIKN